jgi:hypothetical protein
MGIKRVGMQIHQLMDENYRLFFNIKPPEVEIEKEVDDERKSLEGEEDEFELLERQPLEEGETGDGKTEVEEMPFISKTEEHTGAESELVMETLLETCSTPSIVPVASTSHVSIAKIAEHLSQFEVKPDAESESKFALFLQSLRQTGETEGEGKVEIKFDDELHSVVGT